MFIYLVENSQYSISYQNLRNDYLKYCLMSDEDFLKHLKDILHFACIVCWMKERSEAALRDDGVIHQLVHILGKVNCDMNEKELLSITRDIFNRECCLA